MGARWTDSEDSVIRDMWLDFIAEEISEALPGRTEHSVFSRAQALGLSKTSQQKTRSQRLHANRKIGALLGEPICEWLRRRYEDEEATYDELLAEIGVCNRTIMRLMKDCGISPLTPSERALRQIRNNPDVIDNLVSAGQSSESKRKRAITRRENWRTVQSDNEREFMEALHAVGLSPWPEYPVDRYNIDFAFPAAKLAVELDPLWHKAGRKAIQDAKKDALLESLGWTVLRVESRCKTSFNVSKIESALRELAERQPEDDNT